uniref:Uncharacterized protein n=1 Tax=Aceria tosichella TaxID=561515 RepID=A0A6G1SN91_9ACAR
MTIEKPDLAGPFPHDDTASDDDGALLEFARKLVADEMKDHTQDNAISLPERRFLSDLLRNELVNQEQNKTRDDMTELSRITTDTPPPTSANIGDDELRAWNRCLAQMKIKLEYGQRQLSNLEIMKTCGVPAWEEYLARSERMKNKQ